MQVAEAFNSGQSVQSLAAQYNVLTETIIAHLFRYYTNGGKLNIEKLKNIIAVPESEWGYIFKEFEEAADFSLKPIFEKYNGRISYNDLRLLRIIHSPSEKKNDWL